MTAEDDGTRDDKPANGGRKSRTRRQRPPVTIDLTAERVAADKDRGGQDGVRAGQG